MVVSPLIMKKTISAQPGNVQGNTEAGPGNPRGWRYRGEDFSMELSMPTNKEQWGPQNTHSLATCSL